MSAFYILAGANHFLNPAFYEPIMPPYLPYHLALIYISGVAESMIGIFLIPKSTRRIAAWLLIILLIIIFPANIQMTINYWKESNPDMWISIVRLPIQFILIWWAWVYTKKQSLQAPTTADSSAHR